MAWFHRYRYNKMGSLIANAIANYKTDFQDIHLNFGKFWKFFWEKSSSPWVLHIAGHTE